LSARLLIAIDGPAGSGKSSAGVLLARRLGLRFLDSGLLYRAVTWLAQQSGIAADDERGVAALAQSAVIDVDMASGVGRVLIDGHDPGVALHDPAMAVPLARIARIPAVRAALLPIQRALASEGALVMAGRDIGTVVLPDAHPKFFLQASVAERARRRAAELSSRGRDISADALLSEVAERDRSDTERAVAPLRPAADAVLVDTEGRTLEQVVQVMAQLITPGTRA
jgi:cytidylate kinase